MLTQISELKQLINPTHKKRLVLAAANDLHSLEAVLYAYNEGIIGSPLLAGNEKAIRKVADENQLDISACEIVQSENAYKAVENAVKVVKSADAQVLMKGNIATADLLRGVLNKEAGLRKAELLSHLAIFEVPTYHKLIALADVAMNIAPDLKQKIGILNNSVECLNHLGIEKPKVAVLGAVEVVNMAMQATIDAAILSKMAHRGQIKNCIVDGPLAFDNAVSYESAEHKGIVSDVAGDADFLLVPNIEAGNVLYKSLVFFTKAELAAVILGASVPIVLTSRSDSKESKFNSILLSAVS